MFNNAEKSLVGALAIACALLCLVGYRTSATTGVPDKVWFDTSGGDVIFDHNYHLGVADCAGCHHGYEGPHEWDGQEEMGCRTCHYYGEGRDVEGPAPHVRAVGANCMECHERIGEGKADCEVCHVQKGKAFEATRLADVPPPPVWNVDTDFGRVSFDHQLHISEENALTCDQCHHAFEGGEKMADMEREKSCTACHYDLADAMPENDGDIHLRYIGASCVECHDADACDTCHE